MASTKQVQLRRTDGLLGSVGERLAAELLHDEALNVHGDGVGPSLSAGRGGGAWRVCR